MSSVRVVLEGRITAHTAAPVWQSALDTLARYPDRPVVVDASRVEYVDNVGLALLFDLTSRERAPGAAVELQALHRAGGAHPALALAEYLWAVVPWVMVAGAAFPAVRLVVAAP